MCASNVQWNMKEVWHHPWCPHCIDAGTAACMNITCGMVLRYQEWGGISRGNFVVLQGGLKSALEFLPAMPPSTVSGKVTTAQMMIMMQIVPKGRAAIDLRRGREDSILTLVTLLLYRLLHTNVEALLVLLYNTLHRNEPEWMNE